MIFTIMTLIPKEKSFFLVFLLCTTQLFAQTPNWNVNPNAFEHSMTLTTVVLNEDAYYVTEEITIGVFDGDECVGVSTTNTFFEPISANLAFVLVYGNSASANYTIKVYMNNETVNAGELSFISNAVLGTLNEPFEIQPIFEISGCMEVNAANFNPLAITDDGSCFYTVYGCTDETAFNYNPLANTDDDSCVAITIGCMDANYLEYSIEANSGYQEVLCINLIVYGCTNPFYFEYNTLANIDDNSCTQTWQNAYQLQNENLNILNTTIDSLNLEIENCSPEISIDFMAGWNLIGYVNSTAEDAPVMFESAADYIIIVKNNLGEVYYPEFNFNGIGNLIPGQGYQVKSTEDFSGFQFNN